MRANGLFVIEKNWRAHLLMRRKKFFGSTEALPSRKFLFHHSLLAAVSPFAAVS
jgi:hypothetical protein